MKIILLLILTASSIFSMNTYKLFNANGEEVTFDSLIAKSLENEIILFGEQHNNSICHWLQLQLTKSLADSTNLVLGAEMFEADDQQKLIELQEGFIRMKDFEKEAKVWNNFGTDYKPLLEFAIEKGFPLIATNIPRRYASMVARKGLDSLEELPGDADDFLPRLPIDFDAELPGYAAMKGMGSGHGMDFIAEAQAIKDATMAYFIEDNLEKRTIFIHYNGAYHSDNFEGIYWYLKNEDDDLKILTITTVSQDEINELSEENKNKADFIIVTPSDSPKSY